MADRLTSQSAKITNKLSNYTVIYRRLVGVSSQAAPSKIINASFMVVADHRGSAYNVAGPPGLEVFQCSSRTPSIPRTGSPC